MEVEEVGLLLGASERGVEPAKPVQVDHLFGEVALVHDDGGPLAALALVGGDGVSEFDLEGLGARILLGGLGDFALAAEVAVVEHDVFEQRLHAGAGQAGTIHVQRIQHDAGLETRRIGEILHFQVGRGVAQSVTFESAHDFLHHKGVTVGDEVGGVGVLVFEPMVVVADNHEAVAGIEFFFAPEDAPPDLLIEIVGPAVASGDHDHVLLSMPVVQIVQEFGEVISRGDVQVGVGFGAELGKGGFDVFGKVLGQSNVLPQGVCVGEDAAVEFLTHHVVERTLCEGKVEFPREFGPVEGWGDGAANRGKLGVVSHQDDPAARGLQTEREKVGQEVSVMKSCPSSTGLPKSAVASDHGRLIHDKNRALSCVGGNAGRSATISGGLSEVDAAVNGARL